jgi:uncharacterized protein
MVLKGYETLFLTSLKNYAILTNMIKPDPSLEPEWDEDNINHIAKHGLTPEQVEEVYYSEGPHPTLATRNKKGMGKSQENRYRLWGTDAAGFFIEAVIAPYPEYVSWRCVTAFPMSSKTKRVYLKRIKK